MTSSKSSTFCRYIYFSDSNTCAQVRMCFIVSLPCIFVRAKWRCRLLRLYWPHITGFLKKQGVFSHWFVVPPRCWSRIFLNLLGRCCWRWNLVIPERSFWSCSKGAWDVSFLRPTAKRRTTKADVEGHEKKTSANQHYVIVESASG